MTDTVEVEVDGVIDDDTSGRVPAWGLPVAVAIVSALALVVVIRVVLPGILGAHGQSVTRRAPPKARASSLAGVEDARIAAAQAALTAWGRFAVAGDVGVLAGLFVPDGPQYRQLADEAGVPRPGSRALPYEVTLTDVRLGEAPPGEAVVIGTVVWTRPGEPDQRYMWELELSPADGNAWQLWTVRDAVSGEKPDA